MKSITKVDIRNQSSSSNAFIEAQLKLDETIISLAKIRKTMVPCQNWAHAEGACHDVNALVEQVNRLFYLTLK